jgi:hypothetical protein
MEGLDSWVLVLAHLTMEVSSTCLWRLIVILPSPRKFVTFQVRPSGVALYVSGLIRVSPTCPNTRLLLSAAGVECFCLIA